MTLVRLLLFLGSTDASRKETGRKELLNVAAFLNYVEANYSIAKHCIRLSILSFKQTLPITVTFCRL